MASENQGHIEGKTAHRPNQFRRIVVFTVFLFWELLCHPLAAQNTPDLTGNWQGTVEAGRGFRIILQISQSSQDQTGKGAWQGVFYTMGVGGTRESDLNSLTLEGATLRFQIPPYGSFEGNLKADGKSIAGTLKQGAISYALTLVRATPASAWEAPKPTDHMPPDAMPEFEVATIKPTDPSWASRGFHIRGRRITCDGETISDIISIAYGVQKKQIIGGPAWLGADKYDVDGVADLAGQPNLKQIQAMYRGLLVSRSNLAFHFETRELPVYALRVGKSGSKLAKSLGDPKGTPDQTYNQDPQLVDVRETNASIAEFSEVMGDILEKPIVDQTGLAGRFDFRLRWTPGGAQLAAPNAPPGLFTAIQEQLGLKLEATKAPVDVIVVDHIDRPSPN